MEYGLIVTILCLTIVFGMLILLVGSLYLLKIFGYKPKKLDGDGGQEEPTIQEDDASIIAAISAAISVVLSSQSEEKKAKFVVRSIKRI